MKRGPGLEKLPYRSIQIGIGRKLSKIWSEEWIVSIEDVTEKALMLKEAVSKEAQDADHGRQRLIDMGCMMNEKEYKLPVELAERLKMN